ncbi:siderophore-interacting protein [Cellulomonas pakistanensis]|uniref:Siderophore-interacting protein n=1 Tax=Cellulomonas pakistanensis TaxID=992287 RepID=A0A919PBD4_9CELL|nr:siderophore-interacting protein [Cellulomonas pakistanensis]GIG37890.1 siderophore-interacting protein [Cellulomonas pakistanensis]
MTTTEPTTAARRPPRTALRATVLHAEHLTPAMVRLTLGGPGVAGFAPSPHADSYVKLLFVPGLGETASGADVLAAWTTPDGRVDLEAARAALPPEHQPRMRTYTVRRFDDLELTLTLDLVVHGAEGIAGPWAATAAPGDEVVVVGPGGGYTPDLTADHHLLAGDASALPAIAVALERLGPAASGYAVLEVHDRAEEQALHVPDGIALRWVHAGDAAPGARLVEAVRALPWPDGRVHAFVHGEAGSVRELRRYLRVERGLGKDDLSISGYWRLGADDEGWRAGKREWLRGIEDAEAAAGLD